MNKEMRNTKIKNSFSISALFFGIAIVYIILLFPMAKESNENEIADNKSTELVEEVSKKIEDIEEKYKCIKIVDGFNKSEVKGIDSLKRSSYAYDVLIDYEKESKAINEIKIILNRLPEGMLLEALEWGGDKYREENQDIINFVENYSDKYEEIRIVLCSNIRRKNGNIEYGYYSGGVTFIDGDIVYICINTKRIGNIQRIFAHELYHYFHHRIENQLYTGEVYTMKEWNEELPTDYEYRGDDLDEINMPYSIYTAKDINNVYFVSSYAQKSINEDKAEMFSYLLEKGKYGSLPLAYKSPHIKKRTKMIIDELDKYFDTVDENAYWNIVYEEKVK